MATSAERIYEAAAGVLSSQQQRATQITGSVAPIGSAAAAAALLVKPALVKVHSAGALQVVFLLVALLGILFVLAGAVAVLGGVQMETIDPAKLLEAAEQDPSLLKAGDRFHLEAATTLAATRQTNDEALEKLEANFVQMASGLVMEIVGLSVAAAVHF